MPKPIPIYKGIDHELEFKGLTPPFLYFMIALLLGTIFLFLFLKAMGLPVLLSLGMTLAQLAYLSNRIYRLNRELGKNGMLKKSAYSKVPLVIRIKDRGPILKLGIQSK